MKIKKNIVSQKRDDGSYQHPLYVDGEDMTVNSSRTLLECLMKKCESSLKNDFIARIEINKKLLWYTYEDFMNQVKSLATYLHSFVKKDELIGIFSINRIEWLISEYASYMTHTINCPLYSTFGVESLLHILNETEMRICIISGSKAVSLYEDIISKNKTKLTDLILMDPIEEKYLDLYLKNGIKIHSWNDIMNININNELLNTIKKPSENDIATICYTSGTSGIPKGVILTHKNFISSMSTFVKEKYKESVFNLKGEDYYLSYLPLAHVLERICISSMIPIGAKIIFYSGNPKNLQSDMKIAKPTLFTGVPRVFNVFKEAISKTIREKGIVVNFLFNLAVKYKIFFQKYGIFKNFILDALFFNKVKKEFGGKISVMLSGSAPLKPEVLKYLQAVFACPIYEGYGQTEAVATNILQPTTCYKPGMVGVPYPVNIIKLVPIEGYSSNEGEICIKGDNITKGYFKRNDVLFDKEGYLKTGDIGRIEDGIFKIIGRKKEIFKTSLGEYIIPEKVENALIEDCIDDVLIVGREYEDYIVALIVCKNKQISEEDVLKIINAIGLNKVNQGVITKYEIPKRIVVLREEFMNYGEFITPTGKKRRKLIEHYFKNEISALFN
ncbi:Long-chain-fatty-acid--CoA ligase 5 [Astathelohania contejeani]|uniref:Long-chain-fatty-acid--CoA ligase 5 n=1 Tax=Astathelohania contejeani TaxID=164912 RepID=A0ABQ7HVP4_9MICR|nr:Long-chain-fatty-acid--CoA ligase 5 [Thelohania contejeani]